MVQFRYVKVHRKNKETCQYVISDCLWVIELQVICFEAVRLRYV